MQTGCPSMHADGKLRQIDRVISARVPGLSQAVGLRNVPIHGYATVDDRIVGGVVESNLADLRQALVALLA